MNTTNFNKLMVERRLIHSAVKARPEAGTPIRYYAWIVIFVVIGFSLACAIVK